MDGQTRTQFACMYTVTHVHLCGDISIHTHTHAVFYFLLFTQAYKGAYKMNFEQRIAACLHPSTALLLSGGPCNYVVRLFLRVE